MQKNLLALSLALGLLLTLPACSTASGSGGASANPSASASAAPTVTDATDIVLSDSGVTVDGQAASTDPAAQVFTGAAIVYYEAGHDAAYGEGTEADGHTAEEAAAHTVVTITEPGAYRVSGTLSAGQLAVDLGEDAEEDPTAAVTLILDNADITCTVAPAVIFYSVYECGSSDTETAAATVDTSAAGANVILADGSENHITGSYVAKIYKEGTTDKLYKFDGAFYSKMSMNIYSEAEGTGNLYIVANNEGLDSELHLTIEGGNIDITADNDGINTNEDGVSVTTINSGYLTINAGLGAEGDGIDSNGYLVINGGTVITAANPQTGDGGIDSDAGIYLNGGTVLALGSRNDEASADSTQTYIQLSFSSTQSEGSVISLKDSAGNEVLNSTAARDFSSLTFSSPDLKADTTYSLYVNGVQQQYTGHSFGMGGGMGGMGGGTPPDMGGDGQQPQFPADGELPEGAPADSTAPTDRPQRPDGATSNGGDMTTPDAQSSASVVPDGGNAPDSSAAPGDASTADGATRPNGGRGGGNWGGGNRDGGESLEPSTEFTITAETYSFSGISAAE
ncbi:conserved exported hypothetical protein [uncultured Eubacteriales bacterium]|uniref:Carbohydrate-binding domain-containing protein n=1 Tax=uncultured Eubacteriales bacterium TaxID=172733 RepID=A0A212JAV1_9FIRM|nr:conserved exported hypothetical protein [uncultured Eubacteriales bacterium]